MHENSFSEMHSIDSRTMYTFIVKSKILFKKFRTIYLLENEREISSRKDDI